MLRLEKGIPRPGSALLEDDDHRIEKQWSSDPQIVDHSKHSLVSSAECSF